MLERWLRRFRGCYMSGNPHLNGCDYLMLAFDYELRKRGFAGNSCQIVLELKSAISTSALQQRLRTLPAQYPLLNARPGRLFFPKWKQRQPPRGPLVRQHRNEGGRCAAIVNEPLATQEGELARFDLIERDRGKMTLIFTWAHALMDAVAAEHFLAILGRPEVPLPSAKTQPTRPNLALSKRCKLAWKEPNSVEWAAFLRRAG